MIAAGLALFVGQWDMARADCRPDGSDYDHGSTIVCSGIDSNGWPSEPPDPNDEAPPEWPINNLTIIVNQGATVTSGGITIGLLGSNEFVNNNGSINASGAGAESIGIDGFGAAVANNGNIRTTGASSESIGIFGDSAIVTNNGSVITNGNLSEGIGIEGSNATATNNNTITVSGDGAEGIGIEGSNATATNDDIITVSGVETAGIGVEGNNAKVTNSGTIRTLQGGSVGLGLLGNGAAGDKSTVSNSGTLEILGANSFGIGAVGSNVAIVAETTSMITLGGAAAAALGAIGHNGLVSSDSDVTNEGTIAGSQADSTGILTFGFDNTATNNGTITFNGDRSAGMAVQQIAGGDGMTTVTNSIGASININGADAIGIEGGKIAGGAFEIDNTGIVLTYGLRGQGIAFDGPDIQVANATTGQITVTGDQARGIVGGVDGSPADGAKVVNAGIIDVTDESGGSGARGIEIAGDNVRVDNGLGAASTRLTVSGNEGIGIAVTGAGAKIANDAPITVSGDRVRGIDVAAQDGAAEYRVTNRAMIAVGGDDGAGILFHAANGGAAIPPDPTTRQFNNLRMIELNGERTAGIAFDGVSSSTADNSRTIRTVATHAGARGITAADGNDNYVTNFASIDLDGANVIGIDIAGNANSVLNGSGVIAFPNNSNDLIDMNGIELFPFPLFVKSYSDIDESIVGEIHVNGANAVGIRVTGADNRVGILLQDDPSVPVGYVPSRVIASGAGATAVVLRGSGNLLVNDGLLSGQTIGLLGGEGAEVVVNQNLIEGSVRLQGGADELIIADGSSVIGTADGGNGNDTLKIFVPTPGTNFPDPPPFVINGNGFNNFETLTKIGGGGADLTGVWNLIGAGVFQGTLGLTSRSRILAASNVNVETLAASLVSSRLEVRANSLIDAPAVNVARGASMCHGGTILGTLNIDSGASYSVGCSIGNGTLKGDFISAGHLEVEIAGRGPGEFDVLDISGDLTFLGGDVLISFIHGFVPDLGDSFEILRADSIIGLRNMDIAFAGLPRKFEFGFDLARTPGGLRLHTVRGERLPLEDWKIPTPPWRSNP